MINTCLLSADHIEENLGMYLKAHYSNTSVSPDLRRHLGVKELPQRLQNRLVTITNFQTDCKDVKRDCACGLISSKNIFVFFFFKPLSTF